MKRVFVKPLGTQLTAAVQKELKAMKFRQSPLDAVWTSDPMADDKADYLFKTFKKLGYRCKLENA